MDEILNKIIANEKDLINLSVTDIYAKYVNIPLSWDETLILLDAIKAAKIQPKLFKEGLKK